MPKNKWRNKHDFEDPFPEKQERFYPGRVDPLNDDKTKTKEWKNGESTADAHITSIVDLAEVIDLTNTTFQATISTSGEVVEVKYNNGSYTCTYTASDKNYVTVKSSDKLTNVVTIQKAA